MQKTAGPLKDKKMNTIKYNIKDEQFEIEHVSPRMAQTLFHPYRIYQPQAGTFFFLYIPILF